MQKQTISMFIGEARRHRLRVGFLLLSVVSTVTTASFVGPYIISLLLDLIQSGNLNNIRDVSSLLLLYLASQVYGEIIGWRINLYLAWTFETSAQKRLYNKIFQHLINQPITFHADRFGGSLVSQTNKFVGAFERFSDTIIFQLTPTLTGVFAATIILSFVLWQYAVILFCLSIIFVVVIVTSSRFMAQLNTKEAQASTRLTGRLADVVTNILAIKADGQEDYEKDHYREMTKTFQKRTLATMAGFLKVSTGYSSLIAVMNTAALVTALWASTQQIIQISVVYLSVTYTFTVARQLWEMNNIMRNYNRVMGDAHDMTEILNIEPSLKDEPNAPPLKAIRGRVDFKNVTFSHEADANKPLFDDFSLTIKPGEKIGLVGHSGSGKTSLTKLLMRFMDVQKGSILIDGQDIKTVQQTSLRQHIAYVPQEPMLFHRSLEENIRYGRLAAEEREVRAVAKMAHADEFIGQLTKGYQTLVGERGVKLSGGQRQRIVIARAMIKHAPILVLDEATSALDSESEKLIQDALWKLMEGRTAVVIAHRLSTIQKMDRILVMDEGKIVEQGTHRELLRQKGTYHELWSHQTGGFLDS